MIEVLDDELSLENGFKSSLSKIKKHKHRHSRSSSSTTIIKKRQMIEDDVVDLGDLGSPTSPHSMDMRRSTSSSSSIGGAAIAPTSAGAIDISTTSGDIDTAEKRNSTAVDESAHNNNLFDAEEFAEKMKTAAILLAQLQLEHPQQENNVTLRASTEGIRQKIIAEMMALEDDRMVKMAMEGALDSGIGGGGGEGAGNEKKLDDATRVALVVNKEDPSGKSFFYA